MHAIELKVPAVGESITEVQIGEWLKAKANGAEGREPGRDRNRQGDGRVAGAGRGRIAKVLKHNGDTAAVGEVIGYMEEVAAAGPATAAAAGGRAGPRPPADSHAASGRPPGSMTRRASRRRRRVPTPAPTIGAGRRRREAAADREPRRRRSRPTSRWSSARSAAAEQTDAP